MLKQFVSKAHNYSQLLGWIVIQALVTYQVIANSSELQQSTNSKFLAIPIYLTQIFQTLQCLEVILIIVGINHGSLAGTIAQQLGRMVVAYYFMETQSSPAKVIGVLIPWSLAEVNRYVYYLTKNSLTTWLRYNAFIILYPLGIYGQMSLINDYIKRHSFTLSDQSILYIRIIQAVILVGFVFLFLYLLRSRSAKSKQQTQQKKPRNLRSASPPKRD